MATKHSLLTDTDGIHEPKNITTANADEVYVANGSNSGTWQKVSPTQLEGVTSTPAAETVPVSDGAGGFVFNVFPTATYGEAYVYANATATTFTTPDVFQKIGTSITWTEGHTDNITWDTDHWVVTVAGHYKLTATISLTGSAVNKDYYFEFGIDTGGGIAELQHGRAATRTAAAGDKKNVVIQAIDPFDVGDLIYVLVKCTDGTTATISNINFIVELKERT